MAAAETSLHRKNSQILFGWTPPLLVASNLMPKKIELGLVACGWKLLHEYTVTSSYLVGFLGERSRLFGGIRASYSLDKMGSESRRFLLGIVRAMEGVISTKMSFLAVRNAAIGSGLTRSALGWCLRKPSVSSAVGYHLKN